MNEPLKDPVGIGLRYKRNYMTKIVTNHISAIEAIFTSFYQTWPQLYFAQQ